LLILTDSKPFNITKSPEQLLKNDGSNPQKVEGPQPFPEFKFLIDKELSGP
jgi:hypothetical protein